MHIHALLAIHLYNAAIHAAISITTALAPIYWSIAYISWYCHTLASNSIKPPHY